MHKSLRNSVGLRLSCLVFCAALVLIGCSRLDTSQVTTNTKSVQPAQVAPARVDKAETAAALMQNASMRGSKTDACTLLRSTDIQSIQGEALKDAKATEKVEGGLHISQCFY